MRYMLKSRLIYDNKDLGKLLKAGGDDDMRYIP
jgi:hypothetical protein